MSYPELKLENQLCFLVHRLDRAVAARYRVLLESLDLTYPQYLAMLALWEHRDLGISELCRLLHLETGTVSPLIKRLEQRGYVEKVRSRSDERSVSVRLTEAGAALEERARKVPGALASCLLEDAAEYYTIRELLQTLVGRLENDAACPDGTQAGPEEEFRE